LRKRQAIARLDSRKRKASASGPGAPQAIKIERVFKRATRDKGTLDIQVLPASDNSPVPGSAGVNSKKPSRSAMVVEKLGLLITELVLTLQ